MKLTKEQINLIIDILNDSITRQKKEIEKLEYGCTSINWIEEVKEIQKIVDILEGTNEQRM